MSEDTDHIPRSLATGAGQPDLWIGATPAMREVARLILAVAGVERTSALIQGESGCGKELVASAIHHHSRRTSRRIIAVNCGAIQPNVAEAELFGTERGGFTGARPRAGWVEQAHTGTLFLDEIGELPPGVQRMLLRFLETRQFRRMGSEHVQGADVRIIAATLQDLSNAVLERRFRADLFYRINVFTITVPPLRERMADLPEIVASCLQDQAQLLGIAPPPCSDAALEVLHAYSWPGNVRELRHAIEYALVVSKGDTLQPEYLPETVRNAPSSHQPPPRSPCALIRELPFPAQGVDLPALIRTLEDHYIAHALECCSGNQSQAARQLGLTRDQLRHRLRHPGSELN